MTPRWTTKDRPTSPELLARARAFMTEWLALMNRYNVDISVSDCGVDIDVDGIYIMREVSWTRETSSFGGVKVPQVVTVSVEAPPDPEERP